jgi:hypothetical protein
MSCADGLAAIETRDGSFFVPTLLQAPSARAASVAATNAAV